MKSSVKESSVLAACLELLSLRGILAWRNNSGATLAESHGRKRLIRYGLKGSSDIIGILPRTGRFLAVETKRPAVPALGQKVGTLRGPQRAFLAAVMDAGGVAVCVSDVAALSAVLDLLAIDGRARFDLRGEPIDGAADAALVAEDNPF